MTAHAQVSFFLVLKFGLSHCREENASLHLTHVPPKISISMRALRALIKLTSAETLLKHVKLLEGEEVG